MFEELHNIILSKLHTEIHYVPSSKRQKGYWRTKPSLHPNYKNSVGRLKTLIAFGKINYDNYGRRGMTDYKGNRICVPAAETGKKLKGTKYVDVSPREEEKQRRMLRARLRESPASLRTLRRAYEVLSRTV